MNPTKPPLRLKVSRYCFSCKSVCLPKNGDWFMCASNVSQQIFLCKGCERATPAEYSRATPIRFD